MTPLTERSDRVVRVRKLTRRTGRQRANAFLVEGAQAVREALHAADCEVRELFSTTAAAQRNDELIELARAAGVPVRAITERAAATLSETVTPQGLIAMCGVPATTVAEALSTSPRLVTVLVGVSDPGNAGTVVRVADAAGADAVVFAGEAVDPHNGKAVRASTGSLFHLPVAADRDPSSVMAACRSAGLRLVGADGRADADLHAAGVDETLSTPTAWFFGSEAHGLPEPLGAELDATLRVPLYGRAESLNLATAAAVCLYASARAQRRC